MKILLRGEAVSISWYTIMHISHQRTVPCVEHARVRLVRMSNTHAKTHSDVRTHTHQRFRMSNTYELIWEWYQSDQILCANSVLARSVLIPLRWPMEAITTVGKVILVQRIAHTGWTVQGCCKYTVPQSNLLEHYARRKCQVVCPFPEELNTKFDSVIEYDSSRECPWKESFKSAATWKREIGFTWRRRSLPSLRTVNGCNLGSKAPSVFIQPSDDSLYVSNSS